MKVHHLNLETMCPRAGRLTGASKMVCHALLIETKHSLVLVDTGLGLTGATDPSTVPAMFRALTNPKLDEADCALRQVETLGFDPRDVQHVVPTHLDVDHAGGLADFPWATVHVHERELAAATKRESLNERHRYVPSQWAHGPKWKTYAESGDTWRGLSALQEVEGLDDIVLLPLFGHTHGHAGVAVREGDGWIVHAGDAYFHRGQMEQPPHCPWGLRVFQKGLSMDEQARVENVARLNTLHQDNDDIDVFCAHDPVELERYT